MGSSATRRLPARGLLAAILLSAPLLLDVAASAGDICELPPDAGPCDGVCPRWYFNVESRQCEEFIWGCCGGNANNFETLPDCQAACAAVVCPADINDDGVVNVEDMVEVIVAWGTAGGPADVNGDGIVNVQDLTVVILAWGPCP